MKSYAMQLIDLICQFVTAICFYYSEAHFAVRMLHCPNYIQYTIYVLYAYEIFYALLADSMSGLSTFFRLFCLV